MPVYADWFVGGVSCIIGALAVWNAIAPGERAYQLPKVRLLDQIYGRHVARSVLAILGVVLIALGIAIACGWTVQWEEEEVVGRPRPALATGA